MSHAAGMSNTPAYGAAIRDEWGLEPDFLTVNHGSYGATPKAVLAEQDRWRRRMEAQPTRFFSRELPGALRDAASVLAAALGAQADDVVFVPNATTGCNAVLRIRTSNSVLLRRDTAPNLPTSPAGRPIFLSGPS